MQSTLFSTLYTSVASSSVSLLGSITELFFNFAYLEQKGKTFYSFPLIILVPRPALYQGNIWLVLEFRPLTRQTHQGAQSIGPAPSDQICWQTCQTYGTATCFSETDWIRSEVRASVASSASISSNVIIVSKIWTEISIKNPSYLKLIIDWLVMKESMWEDPVYSATGRGQLRYWALFQVYPKNDF